MYSQQSLNSLSLTDDGTGLGLGRPPNGSTCVDDMICGNGWCDKNLDPWGCACNNGFALDEGTDSCSVVVVQWYIYVASLTCILIACVLTLIWDIIDQRKAHEIRKTDRKKIVAEHHDDNGDTDAHEDVDSTIKSPKSSQSFYPTLEAARPTPVLTPRASSTKLPA
eukprot:79837_1